AELAHFEASDAPKTRPNTMNRHGAVMREIGLCEGLLDRLVYDFVDPVAAKLMSTCTEGLDSYRAFTVKYDVEEGGDRNLALHYDNAEVTLNVNIGGDWTGGQVSFFGLAGTAGEKPLSVAMARGHAVLHAGLELHQAEPVLAGCRQNLILWCRSSEASPEGPGSLELRGSGQFSENWEPAGASGRTMNDNSTSSPWQGLSFLTASAAAALVMACGILAMPSPSAATDKRLVAEIPASGFLFKD
ncbi:unnamed protein product, partial [Polarella glacialis]